MHNKIYSLIVAASLTLVIGFYLPSIIDQFNDNTFSNITILDQPLVLKALENAQSKGVLLGVHGWRHENFSTISPMKARELVENGLSVFHKAGLVPTFFIDPYESLTSAPQSVKDAINSTGITFDTSSLEANGSRDGNNWYVNNWRNMNDSNDPIFDQEVDRIRREQPTTILLHVQDWNSFSKKLICDYLQETIRANIFIRIDDIEVNTPTEKIYDMVSLLRYASIGHVMYGVIPAGILKGEEVTIYGLSSDDIFRIYWGFYVLFSLFPITFFVFWKFMSVNGKAHKLAILHSVSTDEVISVIIPAYNEEENIAKCLDAISKQDYVGEMEVVVVNDGSTDRTSEIASKYPVTLLNLQENLGKANALNIGIKMAKGSIIIFSDSDSQMASNAVSSLISCLRDQPDVHAVAGNVLIEQDCKNSLLKYFQMIEYRVEQDISRYLQSISGKVLVCPGPIFAVRRQVIDELQFNDLSVVEDADFTIRILRKGLKIVQDPEAKVYTHAPESVSKWLTQRKRWWYGNLQLWSMHNGWAKRNHWMVLSYFGFLNSIVSLLLLLFLPFLLLNFHNTSLILLRSIAYIVVPLVLSCLIMTPFFTNNRKLLIMLVPYFLIYSIMKNLVVSYLYICYLSGRGVNINFGPRIMRVR